MNDLLELSAVHSATLFGEETSNVQSGCDERILT